MSAIEPAGEKIVRNLQQAVERLQDDLARVELWAGALGCFTKPIPDYGHGQTQFDCPPQQTIPEQRKFTADVPTASKWASGRNAAENQRKRATARGPFGHCGRAFRAVF